MTSLVADFGRALAQMLDPKFRRVFALSILLTLALLGLFYLLWTFGVAAIPDLSFSLFGNDFDFLNAAVAWLAYGAGVFLMAILMFPVASMFIGLFLEEIVAAVEARHYPHLPPVPRMGWGEMVWDGVLFTLTLIAVNVAALAVYLISGPLAPVVFLAVNGYLLGRQYFELVAARRIGFAEARKLRKRHGLRVFAGGTMMAAPLSIPLVSLAVPVLGVATFTHQYHRLAGTAARPA